MTRREYLFLKLTEEAGEVGHEAMKLMVFCNDTPVPGTDITCAQKLNLELNDLLAALLMVVDELDIGFEVNKELIDAKVNKVNTYYEKYVDGVW